MFLINAESDHLQNSEDNLKVHLAEMADVLDLPKEQIENLFPEDIIKVKHSLELLLYCEKMLL